MEVVILILIVLLGGSIALNMRQKKAVKALVQQGQNRERERRTVFSFLNRFGARVTESFDLEETLELVVDFCMNATKADAGAIFLKDEEDPNILQAKVVQGLFPPLHEVSTKKITAKRKFLADYVKKETLQVGEGIIGLVAKTGEAVLIPDAVQDRRVPRSASEFVPLEGLIIAPLLVRGEVGGVLVLINKRVEGQTFDETDKDLVTAIADQAAVTLNIVRLYKVLGEKQRMEQELRVAQDFQALLLPRGLPNIPELDFFGMSRPAKEVGGDYYDHFEVDEDHLGVVIGDVSGKGMPGALVMATVRSTLRAEAPGDLSPRAVLTRVNEHLRRDTKENVFISLTYGVLDRRSGVFRFARAGHEPLVSCSSGDPEPRVHVPNGIVLGLVGDDTFAITEEKEIDLKDAGTVILYTDGVPEAMSSASEEYGEERFHDMVRRSAGRTSRQVVEAITNDIGEFTGGLPQHDDITLVVLQWRDHSSAAA